MTSSRLPIGVGQTIRPARPVTAAHRPRQLGQSVEGQRRRADHPRLDAEASRPRSALVAEDGSDAPATTARAGASSSSPAAITPPPITTTSRIEDVDQVGDRHPEPRPISAIASIAAGSPSWASSVTSGPISSTALGHGPAEARIRALRREPARLAGQRGAGRERLHAAAAGAVALARRAVHLDHHVADLARGAERAPVELAAQDQAAGDAGPERQDDRVARAPGRAGAVLGDRASVGVVVDEHRQAEPLGHHVGERDVGQRQV